MRGCGLQIELENLEAKSILVLNQATALMP